MSETYAVAAREYRRTIGKHEFCETHLIILDYILWASLERRPGARLYALFPLQKDIAEQRGVDEADVSRALKWLCKQKVIEIEGCRYALLPPPWTVPMRIEDSAELRAREAWLEGLDERQLELLARDKSLNEARREVWVEKAETLKAETLKSDLLSRVEGGQMLKAEMLKAEIGSSRVESQSVGSSRTPSESSGKIGAPVGEYPTGAGRVGENPSRAVGENPTGGAVASISVSIDSDRFGSSRLIDSRSTLSRSGSRSDRSMGERVGENPSQRGGGNVRDTVERVLTRNDYVRDELFAVIGEHERFGRSASHWRRCLEEIPDQVEELVGVIKDLKRTGRSVKNPAAWMMSSTRSAMRGQG